MNTENLIKGISEDEIWQQINEQFNQNPDPFEYTAVIQQDNHRIVLDIDIDLGGGFESGYETTTLTAPLSASSGFRFAIHEEHFTDEIGKFFGMQDVVTGHKEFDEKLVIRTNDEAKVKELFASESVRAVFQSLQNFSFGIHTHHASNTPGKQPFLEFIIEEGITDLSRLRKIYRAFFSVLTTLDDTSA